MEIANSRRARRGAVSFANVAILTLFGYYVYRVVGHPIDEWKGIYASLPPALQIAPFPFIGVGVIGRMRVWGRADYTSDEAKRKEDLSGAADELARDLEDAADQEIKTRGLVDPKPLEVRWQRMYRSTEPTGPLLKSRGGVVQRKLSEVAEVYLEAKEAKDDRLRYNRFVIIGDAGSGKTALTLFMQFGLLRHRKRSTGPETEPVPFVLPLSSWNPETKLVEWAANRLAATSPSLGLPMKSVKKKKSTVAMCMIKEDKVILILDAMDEMPRDSLRKAFGAINEQFDQESPLIVTCRTEGYEASLDREGSTSPLDGAELANARIMQLKPPAVAAVKNYLQQSSPVELRTAWKPVLDHLDGAPLSPFAQALKTPLMVWLTGKIYREEPALLADRLGGSGFTDVDQVEEHLLSSLVSSVFSQAARNKELRVKWPAAKAERWLGFLAAWVESRRGEEYEIQNTQGEKDVITDDGQDIAWWRLVHAPQAARFSRIGAGLFGGLVTGAAVTLGLGCIFWNTLGHRTTMIGSLALGLFATVAMGYDCARKSPPPTSQKVGLPKNWGAPGMAGIVVLILGAGAGGFMAGTATGLWWGLVIAAPVAASYAFGTPFVDMSRVATPKALYRSDIGQTAMYTVAYAITLGVLGAVYHGLVIGIVMGILAGLAGGFTYGVIYKIVFKKNIPGLVAWLRFRMAHFWLASTGRLPWKLFAFLEDAHGLGVLRQTGPNYQFSHIKLRDQLAKGIDSA
jgi:hypothetical protein